MIYQNVNNVIQNEIKKPLTKKSAFTMAVGAAHINRKHNYSKSAFTLAEVLITLGIIGVVAALVMPTLTNKIQDKVLETQRKKALNIVSAGIQKMLVDYEVSDVDYLPLFYYNNNSLRISDYETLVTEFKKVYKIIDVLPENFDNTTSADYIKYDIPEIIRDSEGGIYTTPFSYRGMITFRTVDGFLYKFEQQRYPHDAFLRVTCDVNGAKKPNEWDKDVVTYKIDYYGKVWEAKSTYGSPCSASNIHACGTPSACTSAGGYFAYSTYCVKKETDN